ncbi:MAG: zinc-binding alcohol dehydrogenase [Bryobacterales bacterium]|nr:zinc-binding alcohol dehydrogenase [Bryobacterales bacterium]
MTIRKAVLCGARDLRFVEEEAPGPGPGEILVETEVTALSTGTDLANYEGRSTELPGAPGYPRQVGYSNVGVIRACGEEVGRWRTGQRVFALRPHQSAYIAREDELLVEVPAGVAPEEASLAYLTQLGVAALRHAGYEAGERVAVVGLGVIGLCTVAAAHAMGARVTALGNAESRCRLASELGAEDAGGREADLVVLTANPWEAFRLAVDQVRRGGRISILGFPGRAEAPPPFNPLDAAWFYGKQLTLIGAGFSPRSEAPSQDIRFNLRRNMEMLFDYQRTGRLSLGRVITHRLPWSRMREAYELAVTRDKSMAAAVFDWRQAAR